MVNWKDIETNPPPLGVEVYLTEGKTFCIGKRLKIRNRSEWNYKTIMLENAKFWCRLEDFQEAVNF